MTSTINLFKIELDIKTGQVTVSGLVSMKDKFSEVENERIKSLGIEIAEIYKAELKRQVNEGEE